MEFRGRTALVTGAGQGIGRAVAMALAGQGAAVACNSLHAGRARETADEITRRGGRAAAFPTDISQENQVSEMVSRLQKELGSPSIVVHCAGILGERATIENTGPDLWRSVLETNLTGAFLVSRALLPVLKQQPKSVFLHVSSSVGRKGRKEWGAYAVSKFGVEGLVQVLADETGEGQPKIFVVNPGGTRTGMRAAAYPDEDPMSLPSAEEVGQAFLHIIGHAEQFPQGSGFEARDILKKLLQK